MKDSCHGAETRGLRTPEA